MASWHPRTCKGCGARARDGFSISKRGWCLDCGLREAINANRQLAAKTGPIYERWKATPGVEGSRAHRSRTA